MKTNRERFEIIASKRVQRVLDSLDSLGKCSKKRNYEYNLKDMQRMEKALRDKLNEVINLFNSEMNKSEKKEFMF